MLSFQRLDKQDENAPNLLYTVQWKEAEDDEAFESDEFDGTYTTIEYNITHHLVLGVPAYTKYIVRVRAENDEGTGPWSPPAEVFSAQECKYGSY